MSSLYKWKLTGFAARSLLETAWRRLRGETKCEEWSFSFEVVWGMMRRHMRDSAQLSPPELREREEKLASEPSVPVDRDRTEIDGVDVEWFRPGAGGEGSASEAVVYLHGGGYVFGSTNTAAEVCASLAHELGSPVLGVNYRLAPEHPIDEARADVVTVWRSLLREGYAGEQLALAGDSAGGGLAISSSLALRDRGFASPAALGLISPWADLTCSADSYERNSSIDFGTAEMFRHTAEVARGEAPADDPVVSPMYAELEGLPPTLIHGGGVELVVDDCRRLAERMRAAGVDVELEVWPGMVHAFHYFVGIVEQAERALAELADFLRGHMLAASGAA